jgi:hypothetical protein
MVPKKGGEYPEYLSFSRRTLPLGISHLVSKEVIMLERSVAVNSVEGGRVSFPHPQSKKSTFDIFGRLACHINCNLYGNVIYYMLLPSQIMLAASNELPIANDTKGRHNVILGTVMCMTIQVSRLLDCRGSVSY